MPSLTTNLWGRDLSLEIVYDVLDNEEAVLRENEALEALNNNWDVVEESLRDVRQYCITNESANITEGEITNIFKYVVPQALFVERSEDSRVVGLLCAYRFDPEHNLAIVFENEHFKGIGPEDILL